MDIDLKNKITFITGLNGSGKTWFTQRGIIPKYKCLVHDPLKQYNFDPKTREALDCFNFVPKQNIYPMIARENEDFVKAIMKNSTFCFGNDKIMASEFDLLIYEEASRTFPNMRPFFSKMRSFLDTYRHYNNLGLVFICRRASQIHTDIPSLAHNLFLFGNKGVADIKRLNQESQGLGDLVATLDNFEYVYVDQARNYQKMGAI